jgi:Tfp pilus assembly protein PilF
MKRLLVPWLWLSLWLGACATPPEPAAMPPEAFFDDAAFGRPALPVSAEQVFALSPEMKRYLEVEIAPMLRRQGRQRGLVEALHSRAQLRLEYDTEVTRTAAEAFEARAGNCLSLVVMAAALAKHLDLPIEYQVLTGQETWSRNGSLTIVNGHVNITVAKRLIDRVQSLSTDELLRLDFGSIAAGRGAALRPIAERGIVAMFMNNRAAESLVRGELATAYAYAREAVRQDISYPGGFNTLGVIYRRHGADAMAERVFRQALAIDASHRAAIDNLAQLYESQGRAVEAAPLRQVLLRIEREPPFHQFDLGRAALALGDHASAREHFERALARDPDYHEFHYWLAVALAGLGDARGASKHLTLAMNNSTTRRDLELYAGKLDRLKAAVRVN